MSSVREYAEAERTDHATIAVVGLGYVGLPLAVAFDRADQEVIGFDVDESKIEALTDGTDTTGGDVGDDVIEEGDIRFTTDASALSDSDYAIITVPTPVDDNGIPNLDFVESAGRTVGEQITPGTTVVLESTVYPGATEEVLVPAVEEESGYARGEEFAVGYSPERLAPGTDRGLSDVVKVVGADDEAVRDDLADLYGRVVDAGVYRAPNVETAEAAKVVENTQRDLNIALMNELSMTFERLGIRTRDVLDAAGTKWNFHDNYRPGLVGGHCIPVDPNYLSFRAEREGFSPDLIEQARDVNESMTGHAADLAVRGLNQAGKVLQDSRLLVLGLAYKPNVGDIRTSVIGDVIEDLQGYDVEIVGHDAHADDDLVREAFGIDIRSDVDLDGFDGVIFATRHDEYRSLDLDEMSGSLEDDPVLVDIPSHFDGDSAEQAGFVYREL